MRERALGVIRPPVDTVVTFVPTVNKIEVTNAEGQPIQDPVTLRQGGDFPRLADFLSFMYLTKGSGTHLLNSLPRFSSNPNVAEAYDRYLTAYNAKKLQKVLPTTVFEFSRSELTDSRIKPASVTFGNFSLASRPATDEERAEFRNINRRRTTVVDDDRRRRLLEEDRTKPRFIGHDHAIVTVNEFNFYLNFDSRETLLAARVLQYAARSEPLVPLIPAHFAKYIWSQMPIAERELFSQDPKIIEGGSASAIRSQVDTILTQLAIPLRIIDGRRVPQNNRISIRLSQEPPNQQTLQGARLIFPPGVEKDEIRRATMRERPSEDTIAVATYAIGLLEGPRQQEITHDDAIALLDLALTSEGKDATVIVLRETNSNMTSADVRNRILSLVSDTLDEGFASAYRDRLIGGNLIRGINLVSGRLPDRTKRTATEKWVIGPEPPKL